MADSFFDQENQEERGGLTLDFKRVLSRAIRFWYIIVFFLVSSIVLAFYQNRYSERVYPITTSILVREVQEVGGAELLYNNDIINPYRNYLNEPYIIRSYPLIEKVVRDLNFHLAFYREGYVMTTESYQYIPVKAEWCDPATIETGSYSFTLVSDSSFSLKKSASSEEDTIFALGDTVNIDGRKICFSGIPGRNVNDYIGVPFIFEIKNPLSVASSYISRLGVEWAEVGAGIINLSLTGTIPEKEIDFLNKLIEEYGNRDLQNKNETATRTVDFISQQLKSISDSLNRVELQLERFGNSGRMGDMSAEAQRLLAKLEAFEVQRAELIINENYYQYIDKYVKSNQGLDQIILPSSIGVTDPVLTSLISRMLDLQLELRGHTGSQKESNPIALAMYSQIAKLRADISEAVKTLRATDQIKDEFMGKQIKGIESQLSRLPVSERQLIAIQRNYSLLENLYVYLMQKLSEASISKASNTSDIIPVNPPMKGGVISPKPTQNYIISIIIGLTIPALIFIIFEILNNKVQSKEDIEKMTAIPFIGGVGHNDARGNLTVSERPKSGIAESFRALRSNLNYFTGGEGKKIFMVNSSISGEGKTFTTINLATVFALSGKKILIVGADMRKPKIFKDFNRTNDVGLSTYLSRLCSFEEALQDTAIDNLFFISGGPVPPNPSELIMSARFEEFIKLAKEQFEYVIIDTPPLALVSDAFEISKYVDHTVFVFRQNFTPKQFIKSIDEYYKSGKLKGISILLNDIYKSGLGYGYGQGYAYHYGYAYGYGYGSKKNGSGYYEE